MPRLHLPRSSYDLFVYDFPYDFLASWAAISYDVCVYIAYDHLTISIGDKLEQNLTETLLILYDNCKVIVQSSCYLLDRTMTSRKSQGVGTLTVQLSCNYVHGFKRPSMFIFGFHLNCVSKSCDHKSCYEEASVFS